MPVSTWVKFVVFTGVCYQITQQVFEAWYEMAPTCPQLYLYSDADPLVQPEEVQRYMEIQVGRL